MKLDSIDEVTRLRNYRKHCLHMLAVAKAGVFDVQMGVDQVSLSTQIDIMPVRAFVARELASHIQDLECQLRVLGVEVEETK